MKKFSLEVVVSMVALIAIGAVSSGCQAAGRMVRVKKAVKNIDAEYEALCNNGA